MPLIDIVVVWFDTFVCTLIFETNNAILSPKYNIFIIERIMWPGFRMFRGLSFGISPGELSCIQNWLFDGARHFASRRATVCDCHWEYPPGGSVGNLTSINLWHRVIGSCHHHSEDSTSYFPPDIFDCRIEHAHSTAHTLTRSNPTKEDQTAPWTGHTGLLVQKKKKRGTLTNRP